MTNPHEHGSNLSKKTSLWILTTFLSLTLTIGANAQKISFPGPSSKIKSPNGEYTIRNTDDQKQEPAHRLTLVDEKNGTIVKVYSYGRHVDVLWSPDSRAFVVNDYEGSDSCHPILFAPPWSAATIDLRGKLITYLRARGEAQIAEKNDHVYFTVQRWLTDKEMICKITGYGDASPKGFTKYYVYNLGSGFRPYP